MASKNNKKTAVAAPAKKRVQHGGYTYKPIISAIVVCACGGKYVKTRAQQTTCVRCINER